MNKIIQTHYFEGFTIKFQIISIIMHASIMADFQDFHESLNGDDSQAQGYDKAASLTENTFIDDAGDDSSGPPQAKYKVLEKVFARDADGLLYQAVIRRALYGPIYHKQVHVAMANSAEEVSDEKDTLESWQYFVHFLKWSVAWDRWLPESKVLPMSEETIRYAEKLAEEHKALRAALTRKTPGKKAFQNLDTATFLPEWRKTLYRIDQQFMMNGTPATSSTIAAPQEVAPKPATQSNHQWTKTTIQGEIALRTKGLISKKFEPPSNVIVLPFTLKKVLVEGWEIINQCGMVAKIPANVSVREVLGQYLASKGVGSSSHSIEDAKTKNEDTGTIDPSLSGSSELLANKLEVSNLPPAGRIEAKTTPCNDNATPGDGDDEKKQLLETEWKNLSEGIIQLFEEAIPKRLLYENELYQLQAIDSQQDTSHQTYADIYGCEHLLRLLVRLPALLAETMTEDESRSIIAKLNDFVRYMYKNQTVLFQQTYRKLSDLEQELQQKEQTRKTRKRKVVHEETQASNNIVH
jgi:mortality factor 4-like protein 1